MPQTILSILSEDIPKTFAQGIEALKQKGVDVTDIVSADGATKIIVEGEGEIILAAKDGALSATHDSSSLEGQIRLVVAFPAKGARKALDLLREGGLWGTEKSAIALAQSISKKAQDVVGDAHVSTTVIIRDVEDVGDVEIKVFVGTDQQEAKTQFQIELHSEDLEDVAAGDMRPEQLMSRMRIRGDSSKGMALMMKLRAVK